MAAPTRILTFRNGQETLDEIQRLRTSGYSRAGKWSLTQICEHVAKAIDLEMKGTAPRLPWIARRATEPMARWIIRKGRFPTFMVFPAPKYVQPVEASEDDDRLLDWSCDVIRQAESFQGPLQNFPFADHLTLDEWRQVNYIHAAHHLGFLVPGTETSGSPHK